MRNTYFVESVVNIYLLYVIILVILGKATDKFYDATWQGKITPQITCG